MALDPNAPPWVVPEWDDYISAMPAPAPVQLTPQPDTQQVGFGAPTVAQEVAQPLVPPSPWEQPAEPTIEMPDDFVGKPPQADAISGGMTPEQQWAAGEAERKQALLEQGIAGLPPALQEQARLAIPTMVAGQTEGTPDQLDPEYMDGGELPQYMSTRPAEEQALFLADKQRERQDFAAQRTREEIDRNQRAVEDNMRARQESIRAARERAVQIDAEARKLADQTPLEQMTGGQQIASVVAAVIGGIASIHGGGTNNALKAVDKIANDAAQRQALKLQVNARERAGIGEEMASADDQYRIAETVRLATYDAAIKKMETDIQQFDPRGSQAATLLPQLNAIKAARQQQAAQGEAEDQKRTQQDFENDLKLREVKVKEGQLNLQRQKQMAAAAGAGKAKEVSFEDVPRTLEDLRSKGVAIPDKVKLAPGELISIRQAKTLSETGASTEKWNKEARENSPEERTRASVIAAPPRVVVDEAGSVTVKRDTGNLKQADGVTDWIPNTPDEAKAFRKQKAAADGLVQILDEIRIIRDRVGGETSWGNSNEYQKIQVLKNRAIKLAKAGTEGMSSDEDMNKLVAALGAKDPASFRAQAAGLLAGRQGIIDELNTAARNLGYTGNDITYADPLAMRKAAKTASQEEIENILSITDEGLHGNDLAAAKTGEFGPRTTVGAKAAIDRLREVVYNEDAPAKARAIAREGLERLATQSQSEDIRDYALRNATEPAKPSPEDVE